MSWKSLSYAAPLNNAGDYGNTSDSVPAGSWGSTTQFVGTCAGLTGFSASTQNAAINASIGQQVLQLIMTYLVEFRQPCADRGSFLMKSGTQTLSSHLEASFVKIEKKDEEKKQEVPMKQPSSAKPTSAASSKSSSMFRNWAP